MRRLTQLFLMLYTCFCLFPANACAAALERVERWFGQHSFSDTPLSLSLTKNKIQFKGCKQKQYQLALNQQISPMFNVEAIIHYNKGLLNYGVLSQRVKSHEFELVSWWNTGTFRVGFSHKIRPRHEITVPVADTVRLPTSKTAGVYVELPFNEERHIITIGALQESWDADGGALTLPWRTSRDKQVTLQYVIAF